MFDGLSNALQKTLRNLRGYGKLTERNVQDALREVRLALLEADVNYQVAKDFIQKVRERCLGQEVLDSITPGQQIVAHIHEELVALLGRARQDFDWSGRPATVLLLGLHGAGKTTTAGKLARRWKAEGKRVLLVAGDLRRPAAVDQLRILAGQVGAEILVPQPGETLAALGARAMAYARERLHDVLLVDTGGRFQIDADLVGELKTLRDTLHPRNVVLVIDAAIGQESVHVAEAFHRDIGLTGLILTKLDGDARGGAALSVHAVTGCPILLVGTGEKPDNLEPFHPDRMASRILGMGDIVSLVEKAQEAVDAESVETLTASARRGRMDFEDLLAQMRQVRKLGPLENLLEMIPGLGRIPGDVREQMRQGSDRDLKKTEAIILSMTPRERRHPELLDASRRKRIARGSGTTVSDVNDLLRRHQQMRKMMKRFKGRMPRLPGNLSAGPGGGFPLPPGA